MTKKFTDVEFEAEVSKRMAEHEVFMSFTNDDDANYFREWWDEKGNEQFESWIRTKFAKERGK